MAVESLQTFITNDNTYMENGYTVYLREGGPCWLIDPGLPPQAEQIVAHVREKSLQPLAIVLTHAHADHIAGIDEIREALGALPVYLAKEEWAGLTDPMENLSGLFGPGFATKVTDPLDLPYADDGPADGEDLSAHFPK